MKRQEVGEGRRRGKDSAVVHYYITLYVIISFNYSFLAQFWASSVAQQ